MQVATTDKEYDIRFYDVDQKKRLTVQRMMNFFEDSAISQSERLGVGLEYLRHSKLAWVIHQWNIKIDKFPYYSEKIKVRTYPEGFYKFYAFRKFEVFDNNNNKMIDGNSVWLLLDTEKKRPIRVPEQLAQAYGLDKELTDDSKMTKVREPLRVDSEREFKVRFSDIDINNHVNNVNYYEWAFESLPQDILSNYSIKSVKLTYKKEAKLGDIITARSEVKLGREEYICYHKLMDALKAELCFAETEWQKE
jgi:medium-chain acyl-[acyl-carrier-protein] hydrolase